MVLVVAHMVAFNICTNSTYAHVCVCKYVCECVHVCGVNGCVCMYVCECVE